MRWMVVKHQQAFVEAASDPNVSWVVWQREAPEDPKVSEVEGDVALLGCLYLLGTGKNPRMRLERRSGKDCRLFHADTLHHRIVCTYEGSCTELVSGFDVDWHALNHPDYSMTIEERNDRVVGDARIHRLTPWDVVWMKGRLSIDTPAVHRSPQDGLPRWVAFIDDKQKDA